MKTLSIKALALIAITVTSSYCMADSGSSQYSGQASKHAALASGNIVVGTAKAASNVAAVPLNAIATVGELSGHVGQELVKAGSGYESLEISEEVVTQDPSPTDIMNIQKSN